MAAQYLGVLDGGHLAPSHVRDADQVLCIPSLAAAADILRAADSDALRFSPYLNPLTPGSSWGLPAGLGEDARLTLWRVDTRGRGWIGAHAEVAASDDPYPDVILSFGPRGGIRREHP